MGQAVSRVSCLCVGGLGEWKFWVLTFYIVSQALSVHNIPRLCDRQILINIGSRIIPKPLYTNNVPVVKCFEIDKSVAMITLPPFFPIWVRVLQECGRLLAFSSICAE